MRWCGVLLPHGTRLSHQWLADQDWLLVALVRVVSMGPGRLLERGRLREMPGSGFAHAFGRDGIAHELCDSKAELGMAAMIAGVVHAPPPVVIVLVRPR